MHGSTVLIIPNLPFTDGRTMGNTSGNPEKITATSCEKKALPPGSVGGICTLACIAAFNYLF
jgi:hypothetical protein